MKILLSNVFLIDSIFVYTLCSLCSLWLLALITYLKGRLNPVNNICVPTQKITFKYRASQIQNDVYKLLKIQGIVAGLNKGMQGLIYEETFK